MKDRVCTSCYHVGQPTVQGPGSFAVDALLWLVFFSLSMFSSLFPLMLIPLAWTIYHVAVYRKTTCPNCGRLDMVNTNSRKGREALKGPKWKVTYRRPPEMEGESAAQERRAQPQRRAADRRRAHDEGPKETHA